tara:strand:+ start:17407 stop:18735 length:1329 start_codon:yes stop_codon:yes gene_type:complete
MKLRLGLLFSKKILLILSLNFPVCSLTSQEVNVTHDYYFGIKAGEKAKTNITSKISYSDSIGYGFDCDTAKEVVLGTDGFTATAPIYFSIQLPEGNYQIELVLGSKERASETTVKAESRRLMLDKITLDKNKQLTKRITVNLRSPDIDATNHITLKDRELDDLNWDHKLSLEFLGTPAIQSIKITPVDSITTLFLAGDSTVTDQDLEPWASWGQYITSYFNAQVVIANYAYSGASLSSFKAGKRMEKISSTLKKGDYLFIQFGHNDEKQHGEGDGPWLNYTNLLIEFITAARAKEAIPVLVTPTQRRFFEPNGKLKPTHGAYPDAMRAVAKKLNVPLIDLTQMTTTLYENWGPIISRKAFVQYPAHTFPGQEETLEDNTHFNNFGANEIALCILKGIKDNHLNVAKNLIPNIPNYTPENPNIYSNWKIPMSNRFEAKKPDGN